MQALLSTPLAPEDEDKVVQQFAALAQPTRLTIFRELTKVMGCSGNGRGLAAGEIAARMNVAAPTLSFHLKELTRAGLIIPERQGRSIVYRVNGEEIRALIDFMMKDCCSEGCQ